jgi:hypothetical protein
MQITRRDHNNGNYGNRGVSLEPFDYDVPVTTRQTQIKDYQVPTPNSEEPVSASL